MRSLALWWTVLGLALIFGVSEGCNFSGVGPKISVTLGNVSSAASDSSLYLRGAKTDGTFIEAVLDSSAGCTTFLQASSTYTFSLAGTNFSSVSAGSLSKITLEISQDATFALAIASVSWTDASSTTRVYGANSSHITFLTGSGIYLSPDASAYDFTYPAVCWDLFRFNSFCTCPPDFAATGSDILGTCESCSTGRYANFSGAIVCQQCSIGYYLQSKTPPTCTPCPTGQFASSSVISCTDCESGRFANTTASSFCYSCEAGQFSPAGSSACSACPTGKYSMITNLGSSCSDCPVTQYTNKTGSSACDSCEAGKFSNVAGASNCSICPAGTYSPSGNSFCEACGQGFYSTAVQATSGSVCENCPNGKYAATRGQTVCTDCSAGTFSIAVQATSSDVCNNCPAGKASFSSGSNVCQSCPAGTFAAEGSSTCSVCEAGKYSLNEAGVCVDCPGGYFSAANSSSCAICDQGKFAPQGSSSCEPCPVGSIAPNNGSAVCTECPEGKFFLFNTFCSPCEIGKFTNGTASLDCASCPTGRFGNATGQSLCFACPPGLSTSDAGQSTCIQCITGRFAVDGTPCKDCPKGTFANSTASSTCDNCPTRTSTQFEGSSKPEDCLCAADFYGSFGKQCEDCPKGAWVQCPFNSSFPKLLTGYWMDPSDPKNIKECKPKDSCLLTTDEGKTICNVGYTGDICSECEEGYYRDGKFCSKCEDNQVAKGFILSLIAVGAMLVMLKSSVAVIKKLHSFGISVSWLQMVSLFSSLPVQWPAEVLGMFKFISFTNLNLGLLSPECSVKTSFWTKWWLQLMIPFFFAAALGVFFLIHLLIRRIFPNAPALLMTSGPEIQSVIKTGKFDGLPRTDPYRISRYFYAFVTVLLFAYAILVNAVLQPFVCSKMPSGESRMDADLNVVCFSSEFNVRVLPAAIIFFILYVIGIPFGVYYLVTRYKSFTQKDSFLKYFGAIALPYRRNYPWFEVMNLLRKFVIIAILQLLSSLKSPNILIFTGLGVFFLFLVLYYRVHPYKVYLNNYLTFAWIMIAIFCLFSGVIFNNENLSVRDKKFFAGLVILSFILGLLFSLFAIFQELRYYKHEMEEVRRVKKDGDAGHTEDAKSPTLITQTNERYKMLEKIHPETCAKIWDHLLLLPPSVQEDFFKDMKALYARIQALEGTGQGEEEGFDIVKMVRQSIWGRTNT